MADEILHRIETGISTMTKKQQIIALVILRDPLFMAFSTVHEFAAHAGVSPATVVRFAKQLSGGFPELQAEVQAYIQTTSNPVERMGLNFVPASDSDELIAKIFETQISNLRTTFNSAFISSTTEAVNLIAQADHIYTLGSRGSRAVAYYLGHHLNRVFKNADMLLDDDRLTDGMLRATEKDVAIIFALPRYSRRLLSAAQQLRSVGVKIITVNDSPKSPFAPLSDVSFYVSYHSNDFHNSQLSSMLLAETIISLVINYDRETAMQNLEKFEKSSADMEQFYR